MLKEIKSSIIMRNIFKCLSTKKFLMIIKINKLLKNLLNITIKDYKEFFQIEFEISLAKSIKILKDDLKETNDKKYFIYFSDDKKVESKRNKNNEIISDEFNIKIDYRGKSLKNLYKNFDKVKYIKIIKWNKMDMKDLSYMFENCSSLEKINNFSLIQTSHVINMSHIFQGCNKLEEIDLSNFNTSNVTNMSYMFAKCKSLKIKCH